MNKLFLMVMFVGALVVLGTTNARACPTWMDKEATAAWLNATMDQLGEMKRDLCNNDPEVRFSWGNPASSQCSEIGSARFHAKVLLNILMPVEKHSVESIQAKWPSTGIQLSRSIKGRIQRLERYDRNICRDPKLDEHDFIPEVWTCLDTLVPDACDEVDEVIVALEEDWERVDEGLGEALDREAYAYDRASRP